MREPRFWRADNLLARLFAPVGALYGAIAGARMARPGARAGVPVLCIGNLTLGGAGKTPTAIAVARLLIADGHKPVFLSRGFGGSRAGPIEVAPEDRADEVGDEPLLLAKIAPTIVARDRVRGAAFARGRGAGVIVMDDGFQNPSLAKDFSLVVLDGERGVGNARVFPAGPLRAPLAAQLALASALLVIGDASDAARPAIDAAKARGLPILHGWLVPDPAAVTALAGTKVLAFAGIGHPEKFFATLAAAGIEAPVTRGFPDHHVFTRAEAEGLLDTARRSGFRLLTTEKDLMRMRGNRDTSVLMNETTALPVSLAFDDPSIRAMLLSACRVG